MVFGKGKLTNISWEENKEDGTIRVCGEIKKGDKIVYGCLTYTNVDGKLVPTAKGEGDPEVITKVAEFVRNKFKVVQ